MSPEALADVFIRANEYFLRQSVHDNNSILTRPVSEILCKPPNQSRFLGFILTKGSILYLGLFRDSQYLQPQPALHHFCNPFTMTVKLRRNVEADYSFDN